MPIKEGVCGHQWTDSSSDTLHQRHTCGEWVKLSGNGYPVEHTHLCAGRNCGATK